MSEKKEGSSVALVLLIFFGLVFLFQRDKVDQASRDFGRFIGTLIFLSMQRQQQNTQPVIVPVPSQGLSGGGIADPASPNPFGGSSFKWTPPPSILPERNRARCVTGQDSMGRIVTECEGN
jgi:hypothetical protein